MVEKPKSLLTIDELSQASEVSVRTLRYYVSSGLLDKPTGETRSARYSDRHLEQIRNIKSLQDQGFTLKRILELKKESLRVKLNERTVGEPIQSIEIPVELGISIVFKKELCGLKNDEMTEIANALINVLKSRSQGASEDDK